MENNPYNIYASTEINIKVTKGIYYLYKIIKMHQGKQSVPESEIQWKLIQSTVKF